MQREKVLLKNAKIGWCIVEREFVGMKLSCPELIGKETGISDTVLWCSPDGVGDAGRVDDEDICGCVIERAESGAKKL